VIVSFQDKNTSGFYEGKRVAAFSGFERVAQRKLDQLDAATSVGDLGRPGNNLEKLRGNREGQWSIRINDQWRICFTWLKGETGPSNVEIVDYH
jgi:toxin HigB-1